MKQPEIIELNLSDLEDNALSANEEDTATFNQLQEYQKEYGLLEIPVVRKLEDGKYRIIGGHHKTRAWKALGNKTIKAIVMEKKINSKEEEFNLVNSLNTVRGTIQRRSLIKIIKEKDLDPNKLDVFKYPTRLLVPTIAPEDLTQANPELVRKAKINQMALEVAAEIAKVLIDEKDELLTFLVVKDKPVAILRIPFKSSTEARQKAGDIKQKIINALNQEGAE